MVSYQYCWKKGLNGSEGGMEGNEVVAAKVVYRNVLKIGRAANVNGSDKQLLSMKNGLKNEMIIDRKKT
ncbi:hypothetical protein [Peribacillus frigoritolerans]|uniref:Uncharacterized protein n=2 Tax=Peribacillus TaxID=2675229 RepID=A0AAW9N9Y4_9BACI|nr:hypothetical protein [Peribacillus castrilensis]